MDWRPIGKPARGMAPWDGEPVLLYGWCPDTGDNSTYCVDRWVWATEEWWEQTGPKKQELMSRDASHWENYSIPTHWAPLEPPECSA